MAFVLHRATARLAILALFSASPLAAQRAPSDATGPDSTRTQLPPGPPPQRLWITGGFGLGTWPSGSVAGIASLWYSRDAVTLGARVARVGELIGEERSDRAFLVGARTPGKRGFLLAAVGIGSVASWRSCDGPCGIITRPRATAPEYSTEAHANFSGLGAGLSMFGALGPALVRYNAFALTVDVWW